MKQKDKQKKLPTVIGIEWEEYEDSWGPRPECATLHLTAADYDDYVSKIPQGRYHHVFPTSIDRKVQVDKAMLKMLKCAGGTIEKKEKFW